MKELLTGNAAIATGVKLSRVEYIPSFPITPQTEIIELLSRWAGDGTLNAKVVQMDSEHSMITAAGAASITGVRTFTATSSQGLLYGFEMLYNVAGWRAPIVLANVSRGVGAPLTLEPDHNDVLSARDCGFLQIHAETCQEALDSVVMAYRIAEDESIGLPAIVNIDGFYLSYSREVVDVPDQQDVDNFLPSYAPFLGYLGAQNPMSISPVVLDGRAYSYFRYQMHLASINALSLHEQVAKDFAKTFGRFYGIIEGFMLEDADYVIVITNSFATVARSAVIEMRKEGKKVGLLRIRVVRPFPRKQLEQMLRGKKGVVVFDQNISIGSGGILYPEVLAALYHSPERPEKIISCIGGLGGKPADPAEFRHMVNVVEACVLNNSQPLQSILLFTDSDWRTVKKMMETAGKGETR
jgi:pyruvate ferredoxin oxidoreductase alpha subunit